MTSLITSLEQAGEGSREWKYRCSCGKRFTNTYGRSGAAYCPKVRCQLVCIAIEPVATNPKGQPNV